MLAVGQGWWTVPVCQATPYLCIFHCPIYRLQNLKKTFQKMYGEPPQFYACAPGRVNLIGESDNRNCAVQIASNTELSLII